MIAEEEEDDEEEFLESLPVDMMEEEDLEEMKAMAQKASFLTRDLSSRFAAVHTCRVSFSTDSECCFQLSFLFSRSAPVHSKKRRSERPVVQYEKMPRKMQQQEEKELIHLLPIKDKRGLIPQSMEKPGECLSRSADACVFGFHLTSACAFQLRRRRKKSRRLRNRKRWRKVGLCFFYHDRVTYV